MHHPSDEHPEVSKNVNNNDFSRIHYTCFNFSANEGFRVLYHFYMSHFLKTSVLFTSIRELIGIYFQNVWVVMIVLDFSFARYLRLNFIKVDRFFSGWYVYFIGLSEAITYFLVPFSFLMVFERCRKSSRWIPSSSNLQSVRWWLFKASFSSLPWLMA